MGSGISEAKNSSVALSGSVFSAGCLPKVSVKLEDRAILWVTKPIRPQRYPGSV